jgi:hypothetical protein
MTTTTTTTIVVAVVVIIVIIIIIIIIIVIMFSKPEIGREFYCTESRKHGNFQLYLYLSVFKSNSIPCVLTLLQVSV